MKKLLLFLLLTTSVTAQTDTNEISIVSKVEGADADEIFKRVNLVVANVFKSANDVIQLNDKESKKMVVKANGEILIPNQNKVLYPKTLVPYPDFIAYMHGFIFNIACRDGRYKMTISFNDGEFISSTTGDKSASPYPAIMNPSEEYIIEQTTKLKQEMKGADWLMIGKRRKQRLIDALPIELKKYSDNLKEYAQAVFDLIDSGIKDAIAEEEDDW